VSPGATAAAPARAARTAAPARPLTVPDRPRRVSGPVRRRVEDRPVRRRAKDQAGIALGVLAAVDRLSRHRALGGRTWIGLVAFALIGIVTLQLGLLKLNAGIGRALEHEAVLQRENAALSIENSELATSDRVTSWAVRLGMEPVPAGALRFLQARPRIDVARGASALSASTHALTSGEAPAGGSSSSGAAEQSTTASAAASAPGESPTAASSSATGPAESSTTRSTAASPSGESSRSTPEEPTRESGASTKAGATTPAAGAEAPSSSPEGGPAGGTQAGPSG
jgi:hypothetical protein